MGLILFNNMYKKFLFIIFVFSANIFSQTVPNGFESVAYEGFDYTAGQDLYYQSGGSGFTSNWQLFYQYKYLSVSSSSYTYTNLTTTGNKAIYDATCYGSCNQISSSGREFPSVSEGVLYLQFLSNLGSQKGGGTPHIRLALSGSTVVVLGKASGSTHNWELKDSGSNTTVDTGISATSLRMVIVRFDYDNGNIKMYIDPDLSTFNYSAPSGEDAEISGITVPSFDEIGPMFRSSGTPGIDEIHLFKSYSATFNNNAGDNQWNNSSNWTSGVVPTSSYDAIIPSGSTIEISSSFSAVAKSLNVKSGGTLNILSGTSLTVSGDVDNSGVININGDLVTN
tara:strand:+ start:1356 stop:2369 length:1014 start_codon:yes stop_codon:yes gene_type:complete